MDEYDDQHYRYFLVVKDGKTFIGGIIRCRCTRSFNHVAG